MEITYESIKPIIIHEELQDQMMVVHFKAAGQDNHIEGRGALKLETKKVVANAAAGAVKNGVIHQVIRFLGGLVGGAVGGAAGNVARSATRETGRAVVNQVDSNKDMISQVSDTPENRQAAAVEAFKSLSGFYEWDAGAGKWKALVQAKS